MKSRHNEVQSDILHMKKGEGVQKRLILCFLNHYVLCYHLMNTANLERNILNQSPSRGLFVDWSEQLPTGDHPINTYVIPKKVFLPRLIRTPGNGLMT